MDPTVEDLKKKAIEEAKVSIGHPWTADGEIEATHITHGLSNYIIELNHAPSHERVIVRFYGSALTGKGNSHKPMSEEEEVAIMIKLAERNLAPKIIHTFPGGRIESFVSGRLIRFDEIRDEAINKTIAVRLAHIHSMKDMLERKQPLFNVDILFKFLSDFEKKRNVQAIDLSEEDQQIRRFVLNYDVRGEAERLASLLQCVPSRIVFSHNDVHMKNIFVLNETSDLLLMDYEYSGYNYRWADLANHLCEVSLHSFDLTTGQCKVPEYNRSEREQFLETYLKEWLRLNPLSEDATVDSMENLMMEVDFGLQVVHLMRVVFFAAYVSTNFGPLQSWSYTKLRLEKYMQSKEEFVTKYSESALLSPRPLFTPLEQ